MKIAVRQTKKNGAKAWVVDWHVPGEKRRRRFFATKDVAEEFRTNLATNGTKVGDFWKALTAKERDALIGFTRMAQEKGVSLADLVVRMDGQIDSDLVPAPLLEDAISECLASKLSSNRRAGYVKDLGLVLTAFAKGRKTQRVSQVTAAEVEAFAARYENLHSRSTILNRINTLFSFSVRRGYMRNNPCDRIERVTIDHKPPQILAPEEAAKLMEAVRSTFPRGLAWFSLCLFAGVRPEEADKLDWDAIDLSRGIVQVDAAAAKVRQRRIVHLLPAAIAWLQVAKDTKAEMPIPNVTRRRMQRDLRGTMGWEAWPQDILRHTAASYWLASVQDAGKVAHELGNSAGILLRHYRELVTKEDAARFWAIRPQGLSGKHPTKVSGDLRPAQVSQVKEG